MSPAAPAIKRRSLVPLVMDAGLPLLVLVVYLNLSQILVESFSIPSILQPLLLLLVIPIVCYGDVFRPQSAVLRPLTIALFGYCLVVFASSNWARDVAVADGELSDLLKSLMLMVVVASLAASWRALRGALLVIVCAAVLLSLIALLQVALGNPDLQLGGFAELEKGHLFGDLSELRPSGPVGDPNYFARVLILAVPAAAFLGVGRRDRRERAGYIAAAGVIALAILFTYSRGAMVALAAVALLLVLVRRVRITWTSALAVVVLLAVLVPTTVGQRIRTMSTLVSDAASSDESVEKRRHLLAAGWRMFTDHPFLGVGGGNFGSRYPAYANLVGLASIDYTPAGVRQYAHNLYLETAAETGLLGLVVFAGAMTVAMVSLHRARRALLERGESANAALVTAIAIALAGYLVASLFLHSGFQRYLWLLLGFAVAASRLTHEQRAEPN